jgi:hypothetical protein
MVVSAVAPPLAVFERLGIPERGDHAVLGAQRFTAAISSFHAEGFGRRGDFPGEFSAQKAPQWLKPLMRLFLYRSGKPLRHPKASLAQAAMPNF